MHQLRKEAAQFLYKDNVPVFMVQSNGTLKWYKLELANQSDLEEVFDAKKAV